MGLGQTLAARRREHELAGDARAGSWARARARTDQRTFLREHWKPVAGFAAFALAVSLVVCALTPALFLKGLILGVVLATVPGLIWSLTMQATGTAPVMMGGEAEQWTARELRKMRRHGWLVVNHFLLRRDDVDHVLIGPGGVYAVETKWSASWDSDFARAREHDAVRQAASSARSMGLWEPLRKHGLKVHPVVVLWGGGVGKWEGTDRIRVLNGVPVLVGPAVGDWAESLGTSVLDPAAVENAWTAIDTQARSRDAFDRSTHPVPMSVGEYVARCGVGVASAFLGFLGVAQLLEWTDSTASVVGIGAGTLVPVVLLRLRRLRAGSWGWIAGVGLPMVALVIAEALTGLHQIGHSAGDMWPIGHAWLQTSATIPPRYRPTTAWGEMW